KLLLALAKRFLDSFALGGIPRDAAVSDEAPLLIEHRQARGGHVALATVLHRPRQLEITERKVRVERLTVTPPGFFVRRQVGQFPTRLANLGARRRRVAETFGVKPDEPMLCIGLPVDLEGEFHESAKAFLTLTQRRFRPLALG